MVDTLDAKKTALARQAADARAAIRALRAYGSEREVLDCDVLGPQYIEARAKLDAAQGGRLWPDLPPNGRVFYCARAADQISTRLDKARGGTSGWRHVFAETLHEGLAMFAMVGAGLAWFFGTFVLPAAFAIHWTGDVASPVLRALIVLLGMSVMGIAYNVTVATLSGAFHAAETWWRGRK